MEPTESRASDLLASAWMHFDACDLDGAIALARQAHTAGLAPAADAALGFFLLRSGQLEAAQTILLPAQQRYPAYAPLQSCIGQLLHRRHDLWGAAAAYRAALALDPALDEAAHALAWVLIDLGQYQEALPWSELALERAPLPARLLQLGWLRQSLGEHAQAVPLYRAAIEGFPVHAPQWPQAHLHLVQCLDRLGREEEAGATLQQALTQWPQHLDLALQAVWRLQSQGDGQAALSWVRRAMALLPDRGEPLRRLTWQVLALGAPDLIQETVDRLSWQAEGDAELQALMALACLRLGRLDMASSWAERAAATDPQLPMAWCTLSQLRLQQRRWIDARQAARQALRLAPRRSENLRQLGWVYMESHQFRRAQRCFRQASRHAPGDLTPVLELGEAQRRAGCFDDARATLQPLLETHPASLAVLCAWARTLMEAGEPQAPAACARLLRTHPHAGVAVDVALRAVALGLPLPAGLLEQHPADQLGARCRASLEHSVHRHDPASLHRLAAWADQQLDPESRLALASLYVASLQDDAQASALARQARVAFRMTRLYTGLQQPLSRPVTLPKAPVRIAYVYGQHHESLLRPVWSSHAPEQVEVFVFTAHALSDLPPYVRVEPLVPAQLAQACAAHGIDVVIDTGGLHPFEGQAEVLQAYARRVAPVQLGWLGCWGASGGFFDAILSDEVAIPESDEQHGEEAILRLAGGVWCWEPPACAKAPTTLPSALSGHVTFGVTSRGLRLGAACIDAMARIVAATPDAGIRFIGKIAEDWPQRRGILAQMQAQGVAASRVFFDPPRHTDYLDWFDDVDILLDSFPSNGGLSLLEPLWMGVPAVTLAGAWAGARQGASILHSAGLEHLVAASVDQFVTLAVSLATDRSALLRHREQLRSQLQASPLLQGRRVASQIETLCTQLRERGVPSHGRLNAPAVAKAEVPDVSVVVMSPSPAARSALADQRGVRFEVLTDAAAARSRHLAFLDNDAVLQEGALAAAVAALDADPAIGALGGRVVRAVGGLQEAGLLVSDDGRLQSIGYGEDPFHSAAMVLRQVDSVSRTFLVTPAIVWREMGGFGETDYGLRVRQSGRQVVCEPSVLLQLAKDRTLADELPPRTLAQAQGRIPGLPRVLVIDNEVPHVARGGGLPRARLMLQALEDWPVTYFPLWTKQDHWRAVYASIPRTVEVALGHGLAGLEGFLETRRGLYDVLLVSRPTNLAALAPLRARRPELLEGVRLIYDAEALFALRENLQAEVQGHPLSLTQAADRVAQELALADGASDVLVVSDLDAGHFRQAGYRTHILSHAIAPRDPAPGVHGRQGLLFVGALHPGTPNEDGMLWFIREVLPRLSALSAELPPLTIVGVCLSERLVQQVEAQAGDQIRLLGAQAELEPHYDHARVFIAPARFAGGVPAKVIEAAAHGLPVVASSLLVQQLGWLDGRDILGAQDAQAFAAHVMHLLQNDAVWLAQQRSGWDACRHRYDPDAFGATLQGVLRDG
jgi:tetratricopeptide (TPR) repeat protein/glycosyltransferase involved in cell wall biosynthesis